ncbi:hypothetical protein [uncultured Sphingomonas sp.]|uniref:hypothetical protein n=1 Tax=uncultured Sphingomonas sp. TaxID=158754 RepID=UPI0035C9B12A
MRKKLLETATALSESFMPAEKAQTAAAQGAADALAIALRAATLPGFKQADTGAAKVALARGVLLSVQADEALREAHREFAKFLPGTPLMDSGWGCTSPECGPSGVLADVHPLRSVA